MYSKGNLSSLENIMEDNPLAYFLSVELLSRVLLKTDLAALICS